MKWTLEFRLCGKRAVRVSVVIAQILVALQAGDALSAAPAQDNLPRLSLGHPFPPGAPQLRDLESLKNRILDDNLARIDIAASPDYSNSPGSLADAVLAGKLDMAVVPLGELARLAPRFTLFQIPFLFRNERHAIMAQLETGPELFEDLRRAGLKGVSWWPGEFLLLASRKPVLEPEDLKGLKIAMTPGDQGTGRATELIVQKTSAQLVNIPNRDLAQGFAKGSFDVREDSIEGIRALGVADLSVTLTNHLYAGYAIIANPAVWAKLPPNLQEELAGAVRSEHDSVYKEMALARQESQSRLQKDQHASIFPLSQHDREVWRDALHSESLADKAGLNWIREVERMQWQTAARNGPDQPEISWNTWLEDSKGNDAPSLALGNVYQINLDLARYAYRDKWSASPSGELIKKLRDQGELTLLLQPMLLGDNLTPTPAEPPGLQTLTIKFDRTKLQPTDQELLKAFREGKLSTRKLSDAVNLGSIASWKVVANQPGCGNLAISVWDQARITPLDHIVISFPVQDGSGKAKECSSYGFSKAMGAGMETLLLGPGGPAESGGRRADAALHVFETIDGGRSRSIAVYVDSARLENAQKNPDTVDKGVYAWKLFSVLSTFVSGQGQLPGLIRSAHNAIDKPGARPFPFEDVASELAVKIFGGAGDRDIEEAARAQSALKELVSSKQNPVVVVRLISAQGQAIYLPFGLLAAQAKEPVVSKRFTVIQPMQGQSLTTSACVGKWWIARPPKLQDIRGDARDLLKDAANWKEVEGMKLLPNHDSLVKYLSNSAAEAVGPDGEGLILLAHHYGGNLQFSEEDRPPVQISADRVVRRFPPGSVAILAACATTGKDLETNAIVERLGMRGIDALILSPFAVDASFGTRLALEFEKIIAEERGKHSGAPLLEVFENAVERAAAAFKAQAAMRDMALEFQIAGNPDIRLCK